MLGQLLHSINPSRRVPVRQPAIIASDIEEEHTRNLLWPGPQLLSQPEASSSPLNPLAPGIIGPSGGYDGPQGEIDLQASDIRFILAQDEAGATPRIPLFDSKPSTSSQQDSPTSTARRSKLFGEVPPTPQPPASAFAGSHSRRSSLVEPSAPPRSPVTGAFQRVRVRGTSISSLPNIDETQSSTREHDELIKAYIDLAFGNTAMSYRGPSNKFHILPLESRLHENSTSAPVVTETYGSLGRAEGRRRSNLAKSYTPSNPPPVLNRSSSGTPEIGSKEPRRRTIICTRTFSVSLPEEVEPDGMNTPTPQSSLGKGNAFPFPHVVSGAAPQQRRPKPRRAPMYAIIMVLQIPVALPFTGRPTSQRGASKGQSSAHGHDSLGSSLDSDRRAGWAFVDSAFGVESILSNSLSSDVDEKVDIINQHWDVITRTLTSLQVIVQEKILAHLRLSDAASPPIPAPVRAPQARFGGREPSAQQNVRRTLKLQPYALAADAEVKKALEHAGERVGRGMRIPRVVTGQPRWNAWREEGRWISRWAGGREQNFFFFNLLTAFLGNHTEWLSAAGPKWYRKRRREQARTREGEFLTIDNRTVIVSADKMAARRLLFLLAAFVPASTHMLYDSSSPMRPSTAASVRAYSQSPPGANFVPSRQQSLRRTINRRKKPSIQDFRQLEAEKATRVETTEPQLEITTEESPKKSSTHSRRTSVAQSINTSLVIPSMTESTTTPKTSTPTTSTVTPEEAVPVAHFTVQRTNSHPGYTRDTRPESSGSGSLATSNLIHTLQRNNSQSAGSPASGESQPSTRWGSFMSFWSGHRRESSTSQSDIMQSTDDGLGIAPAGYRRPYDRTSSNKLQSMVDELRPEDLYPEYTEDYNQATPDSAPLSPGQPTPSAARPIPERPKSHLDSPLKLSVNENDGVIDVDIPIPSFMQSPGLGGFSSVSSLDNTSSFGQTSIFSLANESVEFPVQVAGYLAHFHQDFALQGVIPYPNLEADIKRGMSMEPTPASATATPALEHGPSEKWVEVCSTLIADARTWTIKRIRLRRRVRLIPAPNQPAITPIVPTPSLMQPKSQYGNPYVQNMGPTLAMAEEFLEERFTEEVVMDHDEILVDAIEKVLMGQGLRSSASSRSSSARRGRRDSTGAHSEMAGLGEARYEIKKVLLSALEKVVKSVDRERSEVAAPPLGEAVDNPLKPEAEDDDVRRSRAKHRKSASTSAASLSKKDSSLRDGIRKALRDVEESPRTIVVH